MARWSSSEQSNWGGSERTVSLRSLVASLLIVLLVGVLAGYLVRGTTATSANTKLKAPAFAASNVIDPSISAVNATAKTPDGAVRSVTSFISGLPAVALQTPQQESAVLDNVISPKADTTVRTDLQNVIDTARNSLVGTGSFPKPLTSKLLLAPASYRVDMLAPDRARVQVWFIGVIVDSSTKSAISEWNTNDIQVQWTDHWRISAYSASSGPTPSPVSDDAQPSSYDQVVGVFNGFKAYRYAIAAS